MLGTVQQDFIPVCLESIRWEEALAFDLYLNFDGQAVLYRARHEPLSPKDLQRLREMGIRHLLIPRTDRRAYGRYLEKRLGEILLDERIPREERARVLLASGTAIMEDLMENPTSGEAMRRAQEAVKHVVGYLLQGKEAFLSLLRLTPHDYYTYSHSVDVSLYATALGLRLGLRQEELKRLGLGALLHDVGKAKIDKKILNKPGKPTEAEWAVLRKHPEYGAQVAREMGVTDPEALIAVHQHQERVDGRGYPRGLRGEAIHLYGRITAIADAYDALTTRRPYGPARQSFEALKLMKEGDAGALDASLLREFILLLGSPSAEEKESQGGTA